VKLAVVSVQRPIFRGDKAAAFAQSVASLERFARAEGFELEVVPTAVTGPEEAVAVAAELQASDPDLVLLQATTFATADCYEPLLHLPTPKVIWAIPEQTTAGPLPLNSFCGANFIRSLDGEWDRPQWLVGLPDDPAWSGRWHAMLAAARAVAQLRAAKVLLVGGTAPTFDRFRVEPADVAEWCGATVDHCELATLFQRVAAVSDAEVAQAEASLRAEGAERLSAAQLAAAARLDVALQQLADGYDAIALRCWPECSEQTGSMPCASVARLFDRGCPAACEGDVLGALSMLAIGAIAKADPVLMDLSHIGDDHSIFWHCGNAPKSLAADGSRLATHFNRPELGCVREMTLAAGPTTMLRFTDTYGSVWFEGDWLPGGPDFDGVTGRLGNVRWSNDEAVAPAEMARRVLANRMPHHFAFAPGHHGEAVEALNDWLGCWDEGRSR